MNQISALADRELNALSRRIGKAETEIKEATKTKDESWDQVFNYMAEFDNPRFIADDGFTLTRQARQGTPKLDEQKLLDLLMQELGPKPAEKIWNTITDRKVNSLKLEKAVQSGMVSAQILDAAISTPDPIYARVRTPWSKGDEERAVIFGVEKKDG